MARLKRWGLGLLVTSLAVASACSSRHGLGGNRNCDYLVLPEASESGVVADSTLACVVGDLSMDLNVKVVFLGPEAEDGGLGTPPDATPLAQFLLEHYDVTYRNLTTGGSVQGVDVPPSFRQSIQAIFDMTQVEVLALDGFPILKSSAKATAPLNIDSFYGSPRRRVRSDDDLLGPSRDG